MSMRTFGLAILACCVAAVSADPLVFTPVQPDLFAEPHALSSAFADFDGDGDLDLSVTDTFPDNGGHRLFRNELPKASRRRSL